MSGEVPKFWAQTLNSQKLVSSSTTGNEQDSLKAEGCGLWASSRSKAYTDIDEAGLNLYVVIVSLARRLDEKDLVLCILQ